jgi:hypothetical protein
MQSSPLANGEWQTPFATRHSLFASNPSVQELQFGGRLRWQRMAKISRRALQITFAG